MANASVLVGGDLVRTDSFSGMAFNNRSGYLARFSYKGKTYIHIEKSNYKRSDVSTKYATAGYYEEESFLKYRVDALLITELQNKKFNIEPSLKGIVGDWVVVQKLKIVEPYNSFCKVYHISWKYDGQPLVNLQSFEIEIPTSPAPDITEKNVPLHSVAMDFYNRHVPIINGFLQSEKDSAAYLFALCAIQIDNIQRFIFPLFDQDPAFNAYITSQNLEWKAGVIFSPVPELKEVEAYLANLTGYYSSIYANQKAIINLKGMEKMRWFADVLTAQSLSVMPVYDKINMLEYVALTDISEGARLIELARSIPVLDLVIEPIFNNERFVLKILESVTFAPTQGDDFLKNLLRPFFKPIDIWGNNGDTLFEALYTGLDDNRIKAYSIGLLQDADNRMKYVDLICKIWEKTSYNPYYQMPDYTEPPVFGGAYPESYFLKLPGSSYFDPDNAPPFLIYETGDLSDPGKLDSSFSTSFNYKIENTKIKVEKKVTTIKEIVQTGVKATNNVTISSKTEYYGTYHLFQPVAIIGYKSDLDIKFPTEKTVPIFYINYMVQYSAIKYLDFGIMLTAEIALNFTGIGQLQNLKYFSHLKYLSRMSKGIAGENVIVWSAVQGLNDTFIFTGANVMAVLNFIEHASTNPDLAEAAKSANAYLGVLMLTSLGSSYFLRRKAIQASLNLSYQLDLLTAEGIPYILDTATETAIRSFSGNQDLVNSFMRNKLLDIPQGGTVVSVFDDYPSVIKYSFSRDYGFRKLDELALLKKNSAAPMNNYKLLSEKGLVEAKSTEFLLETDRVNALMKYQNAGNPKLVENIKKAGVNKRNAFLDYYGNPPDEILDVFKQKPVKILEFHAADAQGRRMLEQNESFWLKCDFKEEVIRELQVPLDKGVIKIKKRGGTSWFTDPSKKARAKKFYEDGNAWSSGELVEIPAKMQLSKTLVYNEEVFANVDIVLLDIKNEKIGGVIQEIDGLRFNKSSNKIERIISMKLPNKDSWSKDLRKLTEYYFNLPDGGQQLRNYVENVLKLRNIDISSIVSAKIFYVDLRTGKEFLVEPAQFKLMIKSNYTKLTDFERFHPETFGTTKEDLLESSYQAFKNKLQ